MIQKIKLQTRQLVGELFALQRAAYQVEAAIIGYCNIPPLIETLEELAQSKERFLGYFEEDRLIGAISYTMEDRELTICRVVVHPDFFRKGIASRLLDYLENLYLGASLFKVATGKENFPAKMLYRKNGYQMVNELEVVPGLFISHFEKIIDHQ